MTVSSVLELQKTALDKILAEEDPAVGSCTSCIANSCNGPQTEPEEPVVVPES
ncbi:hypothetical protein ACRYCC_11235 [Actinomadura scrupuli]|uniref:hypothetical protein n=1 Tax=Actinomadura scrupuli TaxID=559629 RepID=UPI003D97E6FB